MSALFSNLIISTEGRMRAFQQKSLFELYVVLDLVLFIKSFIEMVM